MKKVLNRKDYEKIIELVGKEYWELTERLKNKECINKKELNKLEQLEKLHKKLQELNEK